MSYLIRRDSPNASDPQAKTVWVYSVVNNEYLYTPDARVARQYTSMMEAIELAKDAVRQDDISGVRYMVQEV
jgi:hypothetical protein